MKRTLLICLALLCATTFAFGKSYTQQGIAYLYDYKTKTKKPIGNVSITVAYAEPTTSRADGTFTLAFKDFGAGKHLVFAQQPFSPGLTVLNKKETDNWSTFEGRLTLIMCSKKDFDTCKQNYYDVGFKSITQRYDQKIAALKKESADYQRRLQELEEERDRIMDNLRNSADAMARIDQSELDDAMQEVLDLYERGEVDEAMKKLEDMKLGEKFLKTLDKKHKAEQLAAEATEDSLLTLNKLRTSIDMYKNNGNWDKAAEALKLLADKLNTYDDVCAYANFCLKQNMFQETDLYFCKALNIIEQRSDTSTNDNLKRKSALLHNLALTSYYTRCFDKSEILYKQALYILQRLTNEEPKTYKASYAATMQDLALLYSFTQRFDDAEPLYHRALEIFKQLAKENPQTYELDYVHASSNLARLYSLTQRPIEAEEKYKEVLTCIQRIAKEKPKIYDFDHAIALCMLADLYYDCQRFIDAESLYEQALEIYKKLVEDNQMANEPYMTTVLYKMALLYQSTQRFAESETMYEKALSIRRKLAEYNPQTHEPDVAQTLNNLGLLYSDTQRLTESEAMYKEAREIYRRLAKDNPKAYERDLAGTLNNLADLFWKNQRFTESEEMYKEALEIRRRLAKDNPKAYEPDVAGTVYNIGCLMLQTERYDDAIPPFEEALEIYRRVSKVNPAQQQWYFYSLFFLSGLYAQQNNRPTAYRTNQELLPLLKEMYQQNADGVRSDYAGKLGNQSFYAIFMQQYGEAEQLAREGLAVDSTQHWIAANLAAALLLQGRYDEAEPIYRQYKDELKDSFLDDFEQFVEAGVILKEREKDVERIKRMLEKE